MAKEIGHHQVSIWVANQDQIEDQTLSLTIYSILNCDQCSRVFLYSFCFLECLKVLEFYRNLKFRVFLF